MAAYPNVNLANQYARDVISGKILACQYVKQSCQRHLDDIEKIKDPNWPYRFDKNKAERFCRFAQLLPHTKGEWARRRLKIKLEPWQIFIFCVIFGWVKKRDGFRRFTEAYIEVPRKNGKSLIAAAVGHYMFCADNEFGAEVYCGATTEKQAWKVFEPALMIAKKLPSLRSKFQIKLWAQKMTRFDGAVFAPIIGDPGDGDSPSCAIIDEYHEHITDALYTTMTTGMGAREQPLTLIITTSGFDIKSPCYDKRIQIVEILTGIRTGGASEQIFGIIYTLDEDDDWRQPESIIKANPNYGISVKAEYLIAKQELGINTPSQTNKIKTKHFNLWVSAKSAYYNMQHWRKAEDKQLTLADFYGQPCYLGIDLATKLDLNCVAPIFIRDIEGKRHYYCVAPFFWVPEETVYSNDSDKLRTAERYQSFVNQKVLIPTDGAEVDYRIIEETILKLRNHFDIVSCAIDPAGATAMSHRLQDEGLSPISVIQNYTNFSDPMREIEAALVAGRFHHDGNPITSWCFQNVVAKTYPGSDDVVRPIKEGKENKIDGAIATMMAVGRAMLYEPLNFLSTIDPNEDLLIL
ncbi:MAG TPA: terminase large subunit [Arsenophonus nasoniae]|uniref:terminase large subunit n=1 Tax=Arsenophonus nasoniae TaxID=638 RepID=UPI00387919E7